MTPSDKLYAVLSRLASEGKPAPHNLTLAGMAKLPSEAAVSDALGKLVAAGRVKIQYRTGNAQRYRSFVLSDGRRTPYACQVQRGPGPVRLVSDTIAMAPKLTDAERRLIDDAVAAGRVTRLQPAYRPEADDFYRMVTTW